MGTLASAPGLSAMPMPAGSSRASSAAGTTMCAMAAFAGFSGRCWPGTETWPAGRPRLCQAASCSAEVKAGTNSAPRYVTVGSRTAEPSVTGRSLSGSGSQSRPRLSSSSRSVTRSGSLAAAARACSVAAGVRLGWGVPDWSGYPQATAPGRMKVPPCDMAEPGLGGVFGSMGVFLSSTAKGEVRQPIVRIVARLGRCVMRNPAAGGGRWVDVPPERLVSWIVTFTHRHGTGPVSGDAAGATVPSAAADGATAECHPPFPPLLWAGQGDPAAAAEAIVAHAVADRTVGVLLVRLGGYAVGVFAGSPPRLVSSKTGSRPVHGRRAGGGGGPTPLAPRPG